jgi:hypothetical protein
MVAPTINH